MRVIDLSQTLEAGLKTFPSGGEAEPEVPPTVRITPLESDEQLLSPWRQIEIGWLSRLSTSGYNWMKYEFDSHAGTHVDSPYHFIEKGMRIADPRLLDRLVGEAIVLDMRDGMFDRQDFERIAGKLKSKIVLFCTGWSESRQFGSNEYFLDFPTITFETAQALVAIGIKSVGLDTPSIDSLDSQFEMHQLLLGNGIPMIENLCNLKELLCSESILFVAAPLKVAGGDASSVRAIAIVEG